MSSKTTNKADLQEFISTAEEYFQEGRYSLATSLLNQILLNGGRDAQVFYMLGSIYCDQGKYNRGIKALKNALRINPAHTDASVVLSIVLNDLGRYQEGRQVFEDSCSFLNSDDEGLEFVNETFATKHEELGQLYFDLKRYREALEQYFKALSLSTAEQGSIKLKIISCFEKMGDFQRALQEMIALVDREPTNVKARLKLATFYLQEGRLSLAQEQCHKILQIDSRSAEARNLLSQLETAPSPYQTHGDLNP